MANLRIINIINILVILVTSVVSGLLSFGYYLGTKEDHDKFVAGLPQSFFFRLLFFFLLSAAVIALLALINFILNKTILKESAVKIEIRRILGFGLVISFVTAFIGTWLFFL